MPNDARNDSFRSRIQTQLDSLGHDLESIESELSATRSIRANGSDDDEHDPDGIPLSTVIQQLEAQKLRLVAEFREAEMAMADLAKGDYGRCTTCGRTIPPARLEIKPTARTCVMCAR